MIFPFAGFFTNTFAANIKLNIMKFLLIRIKEFRYHLFTLLLASAGYQTANTSVYNRSVFQPEYTEVSVRKNEVFMKVLTWNVYMLPYLHLFHDTRSRAGAIGDRLKNSEYDIIFFQETFHTPSREILKKHLSEGYPFFYGPFNDPGISVLTNSGLFVASRIPLQVLSVLEFSKSASFDAMALKGAVLLEGEKDGYRFQVATTHMQADQSAFYHEIRVRQMQQIFLQLLLPNAQPGVPQILCGDLNINSDDTMARKDIEQQLHVGTPRFLNDTPSYDELNNTIAHDAEPYARTLDYIVVGNAAMNCVGQRTVVIKDIAGERHESRFLSDHHAVEALIPLHLLASKPGNEEYTSHQKKESRYPIN